MTDDMKAPGNDAIPVKSKKNLYRKLPKCEHEWNWLDRLEKDTELIEDESFEVSVTYRVKKCRNCGKEQWIPMWVNED